MKQKRNGNGPEGQPGKDEGVTPPDLKPGDTVAKGDEKETKEERIRKWREERQRTAAMEREKRVAAAQEERVQRADARKAERAREQAEQAAVDRTQVLKSLPDEGYVFRAMQDLVRARRKSQMAALRAFAIWVLIPVLLYAVYLFVLATPRYECESVFAVQTSNSGADPMGRLAGVGGLNNSFQDAFMVREHLLSRELMEKMEREHGFLSHFNRKDVDVITRYRPARRARRDSLNYYRKRVQVAVDIQEGILRLHVQALDPENARRFCTALLEYAEKRVNVLSAQILADQVRLLEHEVSEAEKVFQAARKNLIGLEGDFEYAAMERDMAQKRWESAVASLEKGRSDVLSQRRYFYIVVTPSIAETAAYPRRLSNILVALVLLSAGYWVINVFRAAIRHHGRL